MLRRRRIAITVVVFRERFDLTLRSIDPQR